MANNRLEIETNILELEQRIKDIDEEMATEPDEKRYEMLADYLTGQLAKLDHEERRLRHFDALVNKVVTPVF